MRRLCGLLIVLICTLASAAFAQLPLLDNLSRDPTDDQAYGELPWDSLDKTSFPPACSPGYCIMGFDTVSGMFDCGPCSSGSGGTECSTSPCDLDAATTQDGKGICLEDWTNCPPTPTPVLTMTPVLTPTPQLTAAAAPCACRTEASVLGVRGGMYGDNPCVCLPTPDPTATVTSTAAVTTPTYTVPFQTPTPQLTAAALPTACRTVCTAIGCIGGLIKDNPPECIATPAPTATATATVPPATPTYTIPFATPTTVPATATATPCGVNVGGRCIGSPILEVAWPTTEPTIYASEYPTPGSTPTPDLKVWGPTFQKMVLNGRQGAAQTLSFSLYDSSQSLTQFVLNEDINITLAPQTMLSANNIVTQRAFTIKAAPTTTGGTTNAALLYYPVQVTNAGTGGGAAGGFAETTIFYFVPSWSETGGAVAGDRMIAFRVGGMNVDSGTLNNFTGFQIDPPDMGGMLGVLSNWTGLQIGSSSAVSGYWGIHVTDDTFASIGGLTNVIAGTTRIGSEIAASGTNSFEVAAGVARIQRLRVFSTPSPTPTVTAATATPTPSATSALTATPAATPTITGTLGTVTPTPGASPTPKLEVHEQAVSGCMSARHTSSDSVFPVMHRYGVTLQNIECLFSNDLGRNKAFAFTFEIARAQVQTTDDGAVSYSWLPQSNGARCQVVSTNVNGNERCCSIRTDVCPGSRYTAGPTRVPYGWAYRPSFSAVGMTGTWACTYDICPEGAVK